MKSYTIQEINEILKGEIVGNTFQSITAPEQLEAANESEISFRNDKGKNTGVIENTYCKTPFKTVQFKQDNIHERIKGEEEKH